MIKVVNIYKSFEDRLILNNINFEVNKGETLVIIGGSGSGKSTLLKAISGLNRQYKGEILIDGENILHLSRKNLAKKMAILPQGATTPTDLTVKELVSYGRFPYRSMFKSLNNKKEQAIIEEAMEKTHITYFSHRLVSTLSGGERQRTWIAMALAQQPKILLLDEPTEGLDRETERQILRLILAHAENKTLIMVTHRLTAIEQFDELCVIDEAKLIEKGTYAELLQLEKGFFKQLVERV